MFNDLGDNFDMEFELEKYVGKKITVFFNVMEVNDKGYGYSENIKGNLEKVGRGWIMLSEGQYKRIINLSNITYIKL